MILYHRERVEPSGDDEEDETSEETHNAKDGADLVADEEDSIDGEGLDRCWDAMTKAQPSEYHRRHAAHNGRKGKPLMHRHIRACWRTWREIRKKTNLGILEEAKTGGLGDDDVGGTSDDEGHRPNVR